MKGVKKLNLKLLKGLVTVGTVSNANMPPTRVTITGANLKALREKHNPAAAVAQLVDDLMSQEQIPVFPIRSTVLSIEDADQVLLELCLILPTPLVCSLYSVLKAGRVNAPNTLAAITPLVQGEPEVTDVSASIALILSYLYAIKLPFVSDKSILERDESSEFLATFNLPDLISAGVGGHATFEYLEDGRVHLKCYCGSTPRPNPSRQFGNGFSPAFMSCPNTDKCRFQIQSPAVRPMVEYMKIHGLDRLPLMYCPDHPSSPISIGSSTVDGKVHLRVRCTSRPKAGASAGYCPCSNVFNKGGLAGPLSSWSLKMHKILFGC